MPLTRRRAAVARTAHPVAPRATPPVAHWIWYPDGDPRVSVPAGTRYLRTQFTVHSGPISEAQFVVTDGTWKAGRDAVAGWEQRGFADSG